MHRALEYADRAHFGQTRKYTGEPYINHPMAVAAMVGRVEGVTDDMIAAAYLHDVVEDTSTRLYEIDRVFGSSVAELVFWLTDVSRPDDGNRAFRKKLDRLHISGAPPEAKTIKLADLIDNTRSISAYDPEFWAVYRKEKQALLEVLKEGDQMLLNVVRGLCGL